jgi:hypothetical protein
MCQIYICTVAYCNYNNSKTLYADNEAIATLLLLLLL